MGFQKDYSDVVLVVGLERGQGLLILLVLDQHVGLDRIQDALILLVFELWLLPSLIKECFCLFEGITFDQADDGVELHRRPLVLCQELVLLQLRLDSLREFLPIEGANDIL